MTFNFGSVRRLSWPPSITHRPRLFQCLFELYHVISTGHYKESNTFSLLSNDLSIFHTDLSLNGHVMPQGCHMSLRDSHRSILLRFRPSNLDQTRLKTYAHYQQPRLCEQKVICSALATDQSCLRLQKRKETSIYGTSCPAFQ